MQNDFVTLLQEEYVRRTVANPQYSKRGYARDLCVSKSGLHDILTRKKKISQRLVDKIATKLGLTEKEKKHFSSTAVIEDARKLMPVEQFAKIYHWYFFAILNLAEVKNAKSNAAWVADQLGLPIETVRAALKTLLDLKMIRCEGGRMYRDTSYIDTGWQVPSRYLKILHSENLHRAEKALFQNRFEDRELTSITSAITRHQYEEILKEADQFRKKIKKITQNKNGNEDMVYTIALQVFPQTVLNKEDDKNDK